MFNQYGREDVAHGLAAAFRADETPPFEQMVGQLFGRSDPQQRAGLLNELLRSIGPAAASGALGSGILSGILRRPSPQVSPQEAAQVNSAEVQDLARHAATQNPSIIDRISQFYAQHPTLVQTLGNAALSIALSRMAQRRAA